MADPNKPGSATDLSEPPATITGMTGGHHTPRQHTRNLPLSQRPTTSDPDPEHEPDAATPSSGDGCEPKPCWIHVGDQPIPGHVLAWQRTPDGTWTALVITHLPATHITPRPPDQ